MACQPAYLHPLVLYHPSSFAWVGKAGVSNHNLTGKVLHSVGF